MSFGAIGFGTTAIGSDRWFRITGIPTTFGGARFGAAGFAGICYCKPGYIAPIPPIPPVPPVYGGGGVGHVYLRPTSRRRLDDDEVVLLVAAAFLEAELWRR